MKSAPWLATLAAATISLSVSACSKESGATAGPRETATPVAPESTGATAPTPVKVADLVPLTREATPPQAAVPAQVDARGNVEAKGDKGPAGPQAPAAAGSGQNVDRPTYQIKVAVAGSYAAGKPGSVEVTLTPKTGWKVNLDFPTKLEITAPAGVTLASTKLKKEDAASFGEKGAVFRVAFTPATAGAKDFAAKFKFVICNDDSCDPSTEQLSWRVAVN